MKAIYDYSPLGTGEMSLEEGQVRKLYHHDSNFCRYDNIVCTCTSHSFIKIVVFDK